MAGLKITMQRNFVKLCQHSKMTTMRCSYLATICVILLLSCNKDKKFPCFPETATGRIIGFDPCVYYNSSDTVYGAGFVLEINNGLSRDTVATYQIPNGLFDFPEIDPVLATNGAFLFPIELQDNYKIRFSYRRPFDNELTAYVCPGNINIALFYWATKGEQVLVNCVSKL